MNAITLTQQLRSMEINNRDPNSKFLQELVEAVCAFIEDSQAFPHKHLQIDRMQHDVYRNASSAIFNYIIAEEGRKFNPPQNWYTISPYFADHPDGMGFVKGITGDRKEELMGALKMRTFEFLMDVNLVNLNFQAAMNKLRPAANAIISAGLNVPNRAAIDEQTRQSVALGTELINQFALDNARKNNCCVLV